MCVPSIVGTHFLLLKLHGRMGMKKRYFRRIRELRKENGYTIEKMGELLGVSCSTYSKHEKDGRFPARKLAMLADLYGVTMDYLLELSDERDKMRSDYTINK